MTTLLEHCTGLPHFGSASVTARACALKVLEEASELCEAVKDWDRPSSEAADWEGVTSEFADVLQTLVNLQWVLGLTDVDVREACGACRRRNQSRGRY